MNTVILSSYIVLATFYNSEVVVGECTINPEIPEVVCTVINRLAMGEIMRNGLIQVVDTNGHEFLLEPKEKR